MNPGSIEISHTALETAVKSEYLISCGIHIDTDCTCIHFKEKNGIFELVHVHIQHENCDFGMLKQQAFRNFIKHVRKEQQSWTLAILNFCFKLPDYLECSISAT